MAAPVSAWSRRCLRLPTSKVRAHSVWHSAFGVANGERGKDGSGGGEGKHAGCPGNRRGNVSLRTLDRENCLLRLPTGGGQSRNERAHLRARCAPPGCLRRSPRFGALRLAPAWGCLRARRLEPPTRAHFLALARAPVEAERRARRSSTDFAPTPVGAAPLLALPHLPAHQLHLAWLHNDGGPSTAAAGAVRAVPGQQHDDQPSSPPAAELAGGALQPWSLAPPAAAAQPDGVDFLTVRLCVYHVHLRRPI